MATINSFEELDIWKKARLIANTIYAITKSSGFQHEFALRDQMWRSAISVVSNIAEGFERSGNKEFIQFLFISKGSAGELRAQLIIASDQKLISDFEFNSIYQELTILSSQINSLISYLLKSSFKGSKFRNIKNS